MGGRRVRNAQMGVRFPSSPVGAKALIIALLSPSSLPPLHVKRNNARQPQFIRKSAFTEEFLVVEPTITCPKCGAEIKLTESLAAPLIAATRREYAEKIAQKDSQLAKREAAMREKEVLLKQAQYSIDDQMAAKLDLQNAAITAEEAKKAKLLVSNELKQKTDEINDLNAVVKDRDAKLAEAQKAQVELIRKQRELHDAKREMELTIEKQVQAGLRQARDKGRKEGEESLKLKVMERDQTIASMQQKIEELKQKADQGSQQLQRESQIERVMQATVGMYGDLQGIAGKSLKEIDGLDMKALGEG